MNVIESDPVVTGFVVSRALGRVSTPPSAIGDAAQFLHVDRRVCLVRSGAPSIETPGSRPRSQDRARPREERGFG